MPAADRLTDAALNTIVGSVRLGHTLKQAAFAAGVSERTVYKWLERGDPEKPDPRNRNQRCRRLRAEIEKARAQREAILQDAVTKAAMRGSHTAAAFLLEREFPERWSRKRIDPPIRLVSADDAAIADPNTIVDDQVGPDGQPI